MTCSRIGELAGTKGLPSPPVDLKRTKGTDREGGNRVSAMAWMPGKIKAGIKNHEIIGGLDFMATFASLGGAKLPEKDLGILGSWQ